MILLVDGHNLLFRMFYGMPFPFVDNTGKDVTATVGFVGTIVKMIKYFNPTECLVVFDGEGCWIRQEDDENYKANRIADFGENNPFEQLDYIKKVLDYLHIKWIETCDCECDDYIGYIAKRYKGEVLISSNDSDFLQLVNDNVKVVKFAGKNTTIFDTDYVYTKFNVKPNNFALYKALVGDRSDNIKGISKVGPKTAVKIIHSLSNNIKDKFTDIYDNNVDLIKHNLNLIVLPRESVNINIEQYPIDYSTLQDFKILKIINEGLN